MLGDDAVSLYTNHPKLGDLTSFNHALCGLYAAGLGGGRAEPSAQPTPAAEVSAMPTPIPTPSRSAPTDDDTYRELGRMFAA